MKISNFKISLIRQYSKRILAVAYEELRKAKAKYPARSQEDPENVLAWIYYQIEKFITGLDEHSHANHHKWMTSRLRENLTSYIVGIIDCDDIDVERVMNLVQRTEQVLFPFVDTEHICQSYFEADGFSFCIHVAGSGQLTPHQFFPTLLKYNVGYWNLLKTLLGRAPFVRATYSDDQLLSSQKCAIVVDFILQLSLHLKVTVTKLSLLFPLSNFSSDDNGSMSWQNAFAEDASKLLHSSVTFGTICGSYPLRTLVLESPFYKITIFTWLGISSCYRLVGLDPQDEKPLQTSDILRRDNLKLSPQHWKPYLNDGVDFWIDFCPIDNVDIK